MRSTPRIARGAAGWSVCAGRTREHAVLVGRGLRAAGDSRDASPTPALAAAVEQPPCPSRGRAGTSARAARGHDIGSPPWTSHVGPPRGMGAVVGAAPARCVSSAARSAPSSSLVQDTRFSSWQHGFESRWGHHAFVGRTESVESPDGRAVGALAEMAEATRRVRGNHHAPKTAASGGTESAGAGDECAVLSLGPRAASTHRSGARVLGARQACGGHPVVRVSHASVRRHWHLLGFRNSVVHRVWFLR